MKARIPDQKPGMDKVQEIFAAKLKEASLNGFMLGAHSAMKMASDKFGDRIRNATDYDTLKTAALELLAYLEDKAEGLKRVQEGTADEPD